MAASGLTWLQIINRVLVRLRESTVASNDTTDYSTMIGALVNSVKADIEDAYEWLAMRDTYSVSAVPGTTQYALTSAGPNARILDAWNTTAMIELKRGTFEDFNRKFFGWGTVQTGTPDQYLEAGFNSSLDLLVDIYPSPSATNALVFNIYKPQADLSLDADVPVCPQHVLIEETIERALIEKGEKEMPQLAPGEKLFIRRDLLAEAVRNDASRDPDDQDWETE